MAGKVFSIANMKGGVGKTTVTVGLAMTCAAAALGGGKAKVLVIDLDAQANASFWLCGDDLLAELIETGRTIEAYLEDVFIYGQKRRLAEFVRPSDGSGPIVAAIASSPELRLVEREIFHFLSDQRKSFKEVERHITEVLSREIEALRQQFDYILFDTAPGISPVTEAALRASDLVIVPTIPDFISNLGLEAFCRSVWWTDRGGASQRPPWVLANMVRDSAHHRAMLEEMRSEAAAEDGGFKMFGVEIPNLPAIEEAGGLVGSPGQAGSRSFDPRVRPYLEQLLAEADAAAGHVAAASAFVASAAR